MADYLPPEYQTELDAAQRRMQLAQMLQQRGMNIQTPQSQGAQAARISPLAAIATALTGAGGAYFGGKAQGDINSARSRYAKDETADIEALQKLPELDAINTGQRSKFSRSRDIAKTLQTQAEKRREMLSSVEKDAGQYDRARSVLTGGAAPPVQPYKMPEFSSVAGPDGKPVNMLINYGKGGVPTGTMQAPGVNVNNVLPGKEGELALSQIGKTLDERRGKASAAVETYKAANQAIDALESGAKAGGGENFKQSVRKFAQAFNINLPETASTEQLSMALLQGVIGQAKNLRPASDTDLKILNEMAGNASTDPIALSKALAFAQSMALQDLQGFNKYAGENQKAMDPKIQDLFRGATSGVEMPSQLTGPMPYQLEVIRQLQRAGMDISQFRDPSGQPFSPDAKINVNPAGGFPGVAGKTPNAPSLDASMKNMTPARQVKTEQEYNALPDGAEYIAPDGSKRVKGSR